MNGPSESTEWLLKTIDYQIVNITRTSDLTAAKTLNFNKDGRNLKKKNLLDRMQPYIFEINL